MPRWRAKVSRSEDELGGGSVIVAAGSIRSPDDTDALNVELSVGDIEITMRADGVELGSWPSTTVDIRRIDSTAFEFIAEGDRLIFTPDDPATFGDNPFLDGHGAGTGSRKGRRSKKSSDDAEPRVASHQASSKREWRPRRRAAKASPKEKPARRSRHDRKGATEAADADAARLEVMPAPPSTVPEPTDATMGEETSAADAASSNGGRQRKSRHESPVTSQEIDEALSVEPEEKRNKAWIRALDLARKYDAFGLDRVPIDESLRDQEHQHTWDHRVAVSSGLGAHICTICGAIRR